MPGKREMDSGKKIEFSKIACTVVSICLAILGGWMIWKYYALTKLAIELGSSTTPDAALPIAGITAIITPLVSYLMYQFRLKNSRNKYGISENGVPYVTPDCGGDS